MQRRGRALISSPWSAAAALPHRQDLKTHRSPAVSVHGRVSGAWEEPGFASQTSRAAVRQPVGSPNPSSLLTSAHSPLPIITPPPSSTTCTPSPTLFARLPNGRFQRFRPPSPEAARRPGVQARPGQAQHRCARAHTVAAPKFGARSRIALQRRDLQALARLAEASLTHPPPIRPAGASRARLQLATAPAAAAAGTPASGEPRTPAGLSPEPSAVGSDMLACGLFEDELDELAELLEAHSPKVGAAPPHVRKRRQLHVGGMPQPASHPPPPPLLQFSSPDAAPARQG